MKRVLVILCLLLMTITLSFSENLKAVISQYHPDMSKGLIYVSKVDMTLTLADSRGNVIKTYPMACGKSIGPKRKKGDMKTPEGVFSLQQIQEADTWGHNFNDGKGYIKHAYGPWFLRLKTPGFNGIGIHGTHAPESIGTRATEGCIRLDNKDIADLHDRVTLGMTVIIGHEAPGAKSENTAKAENKGKAETSGKVGKTGTAATSTQPALPQEPDSIIEYRRPAWNWPPLDEEAVKVKNPTKKQQ